MTTMLLPPRELSARLAWLNGAYAVLREVERNPKEAVALRRQVEDLRQAALDKVGQPS